MKTKNYIIDLIKGISLPEHIKEGRDRQTFPLAGYNNKIAFLLHEGSVALYRSDKNMLITHFYGPFIIGLNLLLDYNFDVYLLAKGTIRYEIADQKYCFERIEKEQLWKNLALYFMHITQGSTNKYFSAVGHSSYELICNNLVELMNCEVEVRLRTNACDYIHEKTMLSRSGIMKILGSLKHGQYIDTHRGILLHIHRLPKKY